MKQILGGLGLLLILGGCTSMTIPTETSLPSEIETNSMTNTPNLPSIIAPKVELGPIVLYVRDLDRMKERYGTALGLPIGEETSDRVVFSSQDRPFLILEKKEGYVAWTPTSAGLYHIAYLHDTQQALANRLVTIAQHTPESFQGSSDHSVSEAFYLGDPEGNGVELYYDRPRDTWQWKDGQVVMGSAYLDPNAYIATYANTGVSFQEGVKIGHMHLQVGNLEQARKFYAEVLGFDVVADNSNQGALFVSAGGYHHNFGLNVWNSQGAGQRPDNQYGLGEMTITLPSQDDIEKLKNRLTQEGVSFTDDSTGLKVSDPWNNKLIIKVG